MLDPHTEFRLYREKTARLERQLELRRHLPDRQRRSLPSIRFLALRDRSAAASGGC